MLAVNSLEPNGSIDAESDETPIVATAARGSSPPPVVTLHKAPQNAQIAAKLLAVGFDPLDFSQPGGTNAAYFAKERNLAEEWRLQYGAGVLEIDIPLSEYVARLQEHEQPYPDGSGRTEVLVPHADFDVLNRATRRLYPF
jgi:hypothetical protein